MLRVGLTGELGSGKSTVARLLASQGALVLSSDEIGRALMQPGQPVFAAIVAHFGEGVLAPDGTLERAALARLAFDPQQPRVEELNALVHPPVIAAQAAAMEQIAREQPHAVVVVESALIFTTKQAEPGEPWRERFDVIVLVTAPEREQLARAVARATVGRDVTESERAELLADAQRRIAAQRITPEQAARCLVLENNGTVADLERFVPQLWVELLERERKQRNR